MEVFVNSELTRRRFIKAGVLGVGSILTWSVIIDNASAAQGGVQFSVVQGTKGCTRCPNAVNAILKDPKKKAELEKLFPANSKVVFYVRRPKGSKVPDNAIAVGVCTKPLESKADAFVPGCVKIINPDYVYKTLIEKLGKKEEK